MARQLTKIIAELRVKIDSLASQRDVARQECASLAEKVETLSRQLEESKEDLENTRREVDFLTVASRIDTPDNLISARRRLHRMIAKIDRCVALLTEDADIN